MQNQQRIKRIHEALPDLSETQLILIERLISQFKEPFTVISRLENSDLINDSALRELGDILRIHHSFSREPFTKDKFEFALEKTLNNCGIQAALAPRGNPGHDITIDGKKVSLKTQADKNIRIDKLHISKFMELGKGDWGDQAEDLIGLRDQFIKHMASYERIFSLRCTKKGAPNWAYELVEIPKSLLLEAKNGSLRMMHKSTQFPKPGYCDVYSQDQNIKFQLYFDGGTERKLQIKNILKSNCIVHATWVFQTVSISDEY